MNVWLSFASFGVVAIKQHSCWLPFPQNLTQPWLRRRLKLITRNNLLFLNEDQQITLGSKNSNNITLLYWVLFHISIILDQDFCSKRYELNFEDHLCVVSAFYFVPASSISSLLHSLIEIMSLKFIFSWCASKWVNLNLKNKNKNMINN